MEYTVEHSQVDFRSEKPLKLINIPVTARIIDVRRVHGIIVGVSYLMEHK